jgi:hypothetical protein
MGASGGEEKEISATRYQRSAGAWEALGMGGKGAKGRRDGNTEITEVRSGREKIAQRRKER